MSEKKVNRSRKKVFTDTNESARITASNERWVKCPVCGTQKILRILPSTVVKDLPVYCKRCKQESVVNIPF